MSTETAISAADIEKDDPDVQQMSRLELEEFALEAHETGGAARAGLRELQKQFEKLQALMGLTASVDPSVIKGWRSWIARLDNERQKWMDKATQLSQKLQKQQQSEDARFASIIEENDLFRAGVNECWLRLQKGTEAFQECFELLDAKTNKAEMMAGLKRELDVALKGHLQTIEQLNNLLTSPAEQQALAAIEDYDEDEDDEDDEEE
jgi:predicted DNA-binding protein YlxM (UPF0122 family)